MAQEKLLQDLVDQCKALMSEAGYSARTLATYNELWEWHLKPFMQQKRNTMYTSEVGFDFLNSLPGDKLTLTNRWRRIITILDCDDERNSRSRGSDILERLVTSFIFRMAKSGELNRKGYRSTCLAKLEKLPSRFWLKRNQNRLQKYTS